MINNKTVVHTITKEQFGIVKKDLWEQNYYSENMFFRYKDNTCVGNMKYQHINYWKSLKNTYKIISFEEYMKKRSEEIKCF